MGRDAEASWGELWDRALELAGRLTVTRMDAETAASGALAEYLASGETRPVRLDAYVREAAGELRDRPVLPLAYQGDDEADEESDEQALARIRRSLGPAVLARIEGQVTALERHRLKKRATAAALTAQIERADPLCRPYLRLIPLAATKKLTAAELASLRAHTMTCESCTEVLSSRRETARRWHLGGIPALIGVLRDRLRGAGSFVREHVVVAAATGAVVVSGVTAAVVLSPTPRVTHALAPTPVVVAAPASTTTLPSPTTTMRPPPPTTTTPPAPVATTLPAAVPAALVSPTTTTTAPPPTTTTTTPARETLHASAVVSETGTVVVITTTAIAMTGTRPVTGDVVTYSAPRCGSTTATTKATGSAVGTLRCPASGLPVTVTVTDSRGLSTSVYVS